MWLLIRGGVRNYVRWLYFSTIGITRSKALRLRPATQLTLMQAGRHWEHEQMETKVARVETDVYHIEGHLREVRNEMRSMRAAWNAVTIATVLLTFSMFVWVADKSEDRFNDLKTQSDQKFKDVISEISKSNEKMATEIKNSNSQVNAEMQSMSKEITRISHSRALSRKITLLSNADIA